MEIGEKTFLRGEEITITTAPYELYGGWWQDGVDKFGKVFLVVTPTQRKIEAGRARVEWKEQQAGFARLAALF